MLGTRLQNFDKMQCQYGMSLLISLWQNHAASVFVTQASKSLASSVAFLLDVLALSRRLHAFFLLS